MMESTHIERLLKDGSFAEDGAMRFAYRPCEGEILECEDGRYRILRFYWKEYRWDGDNKAMAYPVVQIARID